MKLFVECGYCKEEQSVVVAQPDVDRWLAGELVQKVWPDLSTNEREALIGYRTGMFWCPACDNASPTICSNVE